MRRLILGCGYLGSHVAARWNEQGDDVYVTTRNSKKADSFRSAGYSPIICDVTKPASLNELPEVDTLLYCVGFDRSSGDSVEEDYVRGVRNLVASQPRLARLIYISSTGVYGQEGGEWVDERSPCQPVRPSGIACLEAEQLLRDSVVGDTTVILRLAGIYGPHRVPNFAAAFDGKPILAPNGSYLNLIHIDDAANAVTGVADRSQMPATYVVSDSRPVLRRDYYRELARLLSIDPDAIQFIDNASQQSHDLTLTTRQSRRTGSKRVCSKRIMDELGLQWIFASYREGLAEILNPDGG